MSTSLSKEDVPSSEIQNNANIVPLPDTSGNVAENLPAAVEEEASLSSQELEVDEVLSILAREEDEREAKKALEKLEVLKPDEKVEDNEMPPLVATSTISLLTQPSDKNEAVQENAEEQAEKPATVQTVKNDKKPTESTAVTEPKPGTSTGGVTPVLKSNKIPEDIPEIIISDSPDESGYE